MATTTLGLFTNAVEISAGNASWTNVPAVLAISGAAQSTIFSNTLTNPIELDTPLVGADVPGSAVINNIEIQVTCRFSTSLFANGAVRVRIGSGIQHSATISVTTSTKTFSGDASYWGLSDAEARDFVDGNLPMQVVLAETSPSVDFFNLNWVQARIEYEGQLFAPPVLF